MASDGRTERLRTGLDAAGIEHRDTLRKTVWRFGGVKWKALEWAVNGSMELEVFPIEPEDVLRVAANVADVLATFDGPVCSRCGTVIRPYYLYCPQCGAILRRPA